MSERVQATTGGLISVETKRRFLGLPVLCLWVAWVPVVMTFYNINLWGSERWPTTMGVIVRSQVGTGSTAGALSHSIVVWYRYSVDGKDYESTRAGENPVFRSPYQFEAEDELSKWAAGTPVTVYYHPRKHDLAVLRPGLATGWRVGVWLGAAALVVVAIVAHQARKRLAVAGG